MGRLEWHGSGSSCEFRVPLHGNVSKSRTLQVNAPRLVSSSGPRLPMAITCGDMFQQPVFHPGNKYGTNLVFTPL